MIVSCIETFLGIIYDKYFFILMIHCKQYRLDSRSFKLFFWHWNEYFITTGDKCL